jgi:hypothetical protein
MMRIFIKLIIWKVSNLDSKIGTYSALTIFYRQNKLTGRKITLRLPTFYKFVQNCQIRKIHKKKLNPCNHMKLITKL